MKQKFYKYHGAGNDFILIDNRKKYFDDKNIELIKFLCDRRIGIGADGLMLLENNSDSKYKFTMRYYNSDGNEASMCGNGGRCIVAFAYHLKIITELNEFLFMAVDGIHKAKYNKGIVSLQMTDVDKVLKSDNNFFLNTGSPHHVEFNSNINDINVFEKGKEIRYSKQYSPAGTNVNFVEIISPDYIKIRTYERGVENETYACGTGAVACAISTYCKTHSSTEYNIDVVGGKLNVSFEENKKGEFTNIILTGPAVKVFEGEINIDKKRKLF